MLIEKHLSKKAHSFNEDTIIIKKNKIYGVLDGATGIGNTNYKNKTEASIFVKELKKALLNNASYDLNTVINDFAKANISNYFSSPSCGAAIIQIIDDSIITYNIGDCEILIKFIDGHIQRICQKELQELDQIALTELIKIANGKKISIKEARPLINDILIKHRNLKNKANGYHVIEATNDNLVFENHKFPIASIDSILVYTDGFASAVSCFNIIDTFDNLFNYDINYFYNEILKKANIDKNYNLYPRFKKIDDISVISIKLTA